jgi:hypothetical protein
MRRLLAGLLIVAIGSSAHADPLRIAVAANFQSTFEALVALQLIESKSAAGGFVAQSQPAH